MNVNLDTLCYNECYVFIFANFEEKQLPFISMHGTFQCTI